MIVLLQNFGGLFSNGWEVLLQHGDVWVVLSWGSLAFYKGGEKEQLIICAVPLEA